MCSMTTPPSAAGRKEQSSTSPRIRSAYTSKCDRVVVSHDKLLDPSSYLCFRWDYTFSRQGFTSRFDKDFAKNSHMIAPFGTHTKRRHIYRPVSQSYWHNRKRKRYISQQDPRLVRAGFVCALFRFCDVTLVAFVGRRTVVRFQRHYRDALSRKGLSVHPMIGDGNCLFRSVSHQIYGSQDHHAIVRARCCDYMVRRCCCVLCEQPLHTC